jgi:succinoglycan biosynthesis transport protein ExoP
MENIAKDQRTDSVVRKNVKKDHKQRRKRGRAIQVKDILHLLLSRKYMVLFFFIAALSTALIYTFKSPKVYRAMTRLVIENETLDLFPGSRSMLTVDTTSMDYFRTQCSILKSRTVAENVIRNYRFKLLDRKTGEERLMSSSELRRRLKVQPERDTRLVNVLVEHTDARQAADIANAVADEFILFNVKSKVDARNAAAQAIRKELDGLASEVRDAEQEFNQFKQRYGIISIEKGENLLLAQLELATKKVTEASDATINAEVKYAQVENVPLEELRKRPEIEEDTEFKQLKTQLDKAQTDFTLVAGRYGSKHRTYQEADERVREYKASVDKRAEEVRDQLRLALETAKDNEKKAIEERNKTVKEAEDFNTNIRPTYLHLERVVKTKTATFEEVLQKGTEGTVETGVSRAPTDWEPGTTNIRIVDRALVPRDPIRPRPLLSLALGIIAGLVLGCGSAVAVEYLDDKVKNPDHVTEDLEMPLVGIIPDPRRSKSRLGREDVMGLVVADHPRWHVSEAYRNLRTNIKLMAKDGRFPSLLVTSACPGEGKTTTAENLAIAVAQHGHKVLLVDTDMRRPRMTRHFGINSEEHRGLYYYLAQDCTLDEALFNRTEQAQPRKPSKGDPKTRIRESIEGELWVLPAGRAFSNPTEIIGSPKMENLVAELKKRFDVIIFDSPPSQFSDPLLLAKYADGVLVVVEALKYDKRKIAQGLEHLDRLEEGKVLGAVLNRFDWKKSGGYGYYYGYRSYRYYRYYDPYYYYYYSRSGKTAPRGRAEGSSRKRRDESKAASAPGGSEGQKDA